MKLATVCETELWAGFFGIDENGNQPECNTEIIIEVGEDCVEYDGDKVRPSYTVECPKCGSSLDWPQEWEIVKEADHDEH